MSIQIDINVIVTFIIIIHIVLNVKIIRLNKLKELFQIEDTI